MPREEVQSTSKDKKLKVALLTDGSLDSVDGVAQYILELGSFLQKPSSDCEVHYLCAQTKRSDLKNLHSFAKTVNVKFNGNYLGMPLPVSRQKIQAFLQEHHFDVVHVAAPYSPFFAGRFIRALPPETKVVVQLHVLPYGRLAEWGMRLWYFKGGFLHLGLKRADVFIASTPNVAQFFEKLWRIKTTLIGHPLEIQKFVTKKRSVHLQDKINLVFLGRLVVRKGVLQLVRALSLLKPQLLEKTHLHIGGKGQLKDALSSLIAELNLEKNVTVHGFIKEEEKAAFLASGDFTIFPSLSGESFGYSLLEPMGNDYSIVLGGHNLGYDCVLQRDDLLFKANQPADIAACLSRWLQTPEAEIKKTKQWLKEHVKQFDVKVVGAAVLKAYGRR